MAECLIRILLQEKLVCEKRSDGTETVMPPISCVRISEVPFAE